MTEDEIWQLAPKTEITNELETAIINTPDELPINVILTGKSAARYHFARTLLSSAYPNLSLSDIDKFLVRGGAEREIEKLAYLWKKVQDDNADF